MEFTNLDPLARRRRAKQEKGRMDLVRGLRASRVRLRGRPGAQPGGAKPHHRAAPHDPKAQVQPRRRVCGKPHQIPRVTKHKHKDGRRSGGTGASTGATVDPLPLSGRKHRRSELRPRLVDGGLDRRDEIPRGAEIVVHRADRRRRPHAILLARLAEDPDTRLALAGD